MWGAGPRGTQLVDGATRPMGNSAVGAETPEAGGPGAAASSAEGGAGPPAPGGGGAGAGVVERLGVVRALPQERPAAMAGEAAAAGGEGAEVAGVVERLGGLRVTGGEAREPPVGEGEENTFHPFRHLTRLEVQAIDVEIRPRRGEDADVALGHGVVLVDHPVGDFGDFAGHVKEGLKPAKAKAGARELFEGVDRVLEDVAREYSLTRPQLLARCAIWEDLLHQVETYFAGNQNSVQEVSITPFGSFASGLSRQVGDVDLSLRGTYR